MVIKRKEILIELFIIIFLMIFSLFLVGTFFGLHALQAWVLEIQLHDTYFVVNILQVCAFVFLNISFWTYLLRNVNYRFKKPSSNIVFFISTGFLIAITFSVGNMAGSLNGTWMIYPPLSSSGHEIQRTASFISNIPIILQAYQIFQIGVFGFNGIIIGYNLKQAQEI